MAEIKPKTTGYPNALVHVWANVTSSDTCMAVGGTKGGTVQVEGNFGTNATVEMEGSNDGTEYHQLKDPSDTLFSMSEVGIKSLLDKPVFIRPAVKEGTGESLTITVVCEL